MKARDIIAKAQREGVVLTVRDGRVFARGARRSVDALIPDIREHKADLLRALSEAVIVELPAKTQCDMLVDRSRLIDFMAEAKRRGLAIRYRVRGHETLSTVMPGPEQTTEQLRDGLRAEFGSSVRIHSEGAS